MKGKANKYYKLSEQEKAAIYQAFAALERADALLDRKNSKEKEKRTL